MVPAVFDCAAGYLGPNNASCGANFLSILQKKEASA